MAEILPFKRPTPLGARLNRALDKKEQEQFKIIKSKMWSKLKEQFDSQILKPIFIDPKLEDSFITKIQAPQPRNKESEYFMLKGTIREFRALQKAVEEGREGPDSHMMLEHLESAIDLMLED